MEVNLINIAMVAALCALTSLLAHLGVAVFNDGVRPIIPEFLEGRRSALSSRWPFSA